MVGRIDGIITIKTNTDFWQNTDTYSCATPNTTGHYNNSSFEKFEPLNE
jgi:hypothetical protein